MSSIAQSSLSADARVGYLAPPATIYADTESRSLGDNAAVEGLPYTSVSDFIVTLAASQDAGNARSSADVRGSVYRTGSVAGDSLFATFVGASLIDVQASLYRTRDSSPTNRVAQATGEMSTIGGLTFTVDTLSAYAAWGQVSAFGPSTAHVSLVTDGSAVSLFDYVASQSVYESSGFSTGQSFDTSGFLTPGTYTLWASAYSSAQIEAASLSVPGASPRTIADSRFGLSFSVTPYVAPVPIPASGWMLLSGLALLLFGRTGFFGAHRASMTHSLRGV